MTANRKTPLKQWIIFFLRQTFCVLLFLILVSVHSTVALPYSDQSTLLGKVKKDGSVWSSSSSAAVTISSHELNDDDEDDDSDENDDDDDDEEDDERVRNAVVGAVPVLLGLVAIVVLCLFMLCRKSKPSHRIKWIFRNQHQVNRSDRNLTTTAEVLSSDTEEWMHINSNPRQVPTAVAHQHLHPHRHHHHHNHNHNEPISAYQLPNTDDPPPVPISNMDDPPPSYEEVIRGIYDCRPIPVPVSIRQGITST